MLTRHKNYHLPQEVLSLVLLRLPAKSLLRFRCVSSYWLDLIDSPYFVDLHLRYSNESASSVKFMGRNYLSRSYFYVFDIDKNRTKAEVKIPKYPSTCNRLTVIGICNGLVSLMQCRDKNHNIIIWNPLTQKYRQRHPIDYSDRCPHLDDLYGFGYDQKNNEYKSVMITQHSRVLRVYSLKSDSWSCKSSDIHGLGLCRKAVFADGALHWLAKEKSERDYDYYVVSINLATEDWCDLVPLPVRGPFKRGAWTLSALDDSLCATYYDVYKGHHTKADVWMMTIDKSWTKFFTLFDNAAFTAHHNLRPVAYAKGGGDLVILAGNWGMLMWCDMEKRKIKQVRYGICGESRIVDVFPYLESLIPV